MATRGKQVACQSGIQLRNELDGLFMCRLVAIVRGLRLNGQQGRGRFYNRRRCKTVIGGEIGAGSVMASHLPRRPSGGRSRR